MAQRKKKVQPSWKPTKAMKKIAKLDLWKNLKSRYDDGILLHLVDKTRLPEKTACSHAIDGDRLMGMQTTEKTSRKQCDWCLKVVATL